MKNKTRSINSDKISDLEKRISELEKKFNHLAQFTLVDGSKSNCLDKCNVCHVNLNGSHGYLCGVDNCPNNPTITKSTSIKSKIFSWAPSIKS